MNEIETVLFDAFKKIVTGNLECSEDRRFKFKILHNYLDTTETNLRASLVLLRKQGFVGFELSIKPQVKIDRYTADFTVSLYNPYVCDCCSVIEVDGHEWHERTKDQAIHDKKRDRYLVSMNYAVMRFTGTEVFFSPQDCATESICNTVSIVNNILDNKTITNEEDYDSIYYRG
jgi:very-short-patch-repair endonuclease